MTEATRDYECILFGATGYTGKYTAEHITNQLPTDFKWAIAGRSEVKLKALVDELKAQNPDRVQPAIEIAQLEKDDLVRLAKKTKVLITTVGPYHKYGSIVVEACAENGTHYSDVTGEIPWVYDIVQKSHETAKRNGAIIIPQNGFESGPPDLMCWKLVSLIRATLGVGAKEVIHSVHDIKGSFSGGTLATILSIFDTYKLSDFVRAQQPWSICPQPPPAQTSRRGLVERTTGVRVVPELGTLTDSIQGSSDAPIVHRSWGLYGGSGYYGKQFRWREYMRTRNILTGFGIHAALLLASIVLILPPARWLLKKFVYAPGDGPSKDQVKAEYCEWRAIAEADVAPESESKRAYGMMRWNGSMYHLTGVCLAETAFILAREETFANKLGGGILTPATLGDKYFARLESSGMKAEFKMMT